MSNEPEKKGINILGYLVLAIPFVIVANFSSKPILKLHSDDKAALLISFKYITEKEHLCNEAEKEAHIAKYAHLRPHMRKSVKLCGSRNRVPLYVKMTLDGDIFVERSVQAAGFRNDGPTFLHQRKIIDSGEHTIKIIMKDGRTHDGKDFYEYTKTFTLPRQEKFVVDFDPELKEFVLKGNLV